MLPFSLFYGQINYKKRKKLVRPTLAGVQGPANTLLTSQAARKIFENRETCK